MNPQARNALTVAIGLFGWGLVLGLLVGRILWG